VINGRPFASEGADPRVIVFWTARGGHGIGKTLVELARSFWHGAVTRTVW
jgi:hypothetical protein